ncbi:MAG: hypothetical protein HY962_06215 [Ignavibacteriae bacterium]|nr:hypothetical protein [Ignavibacteriota bacterium]
MRLSSALIVVALLLSLTVQAQVPRVISFQGVLADASGNLLPDGNTGLTLSLYETATGGTALYTETQTVPVVRGVFNVIIGSVTPLPASLGFDRAYFLGVRVGGGTELSPRTALTAAPYALRAAVADVAESLSPSASGVVTRVNNQSGALTLQGSGGTTVTNSGNTITISSSGGGGTGIQGVQSVDGMISVTNPNGPTANLGIAPNAITSDRIQDGSLTANDFAPGVLPGVANFIAVGSLAGGDLNGSYPNPGIAPDAVSSIEIQDGSITANDIAPGVIPSTLNFLSVGSSAGGDLAGQYPNPTIAVNAVDAGNITPGAVVKTLVVGPSQLHDNVTLAAGANVNVTAAGTTVTISAVEQNAVKSITNSNGTLDVTNPTGPATTVNVKDNGISTLQLANEAVTLPKLSKSGASNGQVLGYNGTDIVWTTPSSGITLPYAGSTSSSLEAVKIVNSGSGPGILGQNSATTGSTFGMRGEAASTSHGVGATGGVTGVFGLVTPTTPGGYSAGVRGINNGTGGTGIGVIGYQAGSGWGVYGETPSGFGVYGLTTNSSSASSGVRGETFSSNGVAVEAKYSGSGVGTALELDNGAIRVSGVNKAAFIHTATAANKLSANGTDIDNAMCNGDATCILIVTQKLNPSGIVYNNSPIGVYYNTIRSKWEIFNQNNVAIPNNAQFNVLVIKQ